MADYITVPEVAELLKFSESELPGFKVGGSWRFRQGGIDKWVAGQVWAARETKGPRGLGEVSEVADVKQELEDRKSS
jgi:hypothetical protein